MALDSSPIVTFDNLVQTGVPGSGSYSAKELLDYISKRNAYHAKQREIANRLVTFADDAADSEAHKGDESAEDTAKVHAALPLAFKRLERRFIAAFESTPPQPHDVRDETLLNLYNNFASFDTNSSGGLSLLQSRLSETLFNALDTNNDGVLSQSEILAGISPANRPA